MRSCSNPPPGPAREDDIDEAPYLWSDLLARRAALGLSPEEVAGLLRVDASKYRSRETGARSVGPHLVEELIAMEEFVDAELQMLIEGASAEGVIVLDAVADQTALVGTIGLDARTLRHGALYPAVLQHVAVGRAAGELTRRGRQVEVRRGSRRGDLAARRIAVGLGKNEAAALLGMREKSYYNVERGTKAPPAGLLAELQAIDDFITATAGELEVRSAGGVKVVTMIDDQDQFEQAYPRARTLRDAAPYPQRVHRIAAARRAHAIDSAGEPARIATERSN